MERPKIIDSWSAARSDLGIDVVGPVEIRISESLTVHADILVRNFGGDIGTIGVEGSEPLQPFLDEIWKAGYGVSEFGVPSATPVYHRAATVSCLRDWGWSGPAELEPAWLKSKRK